jgi:sigma-B regulation protein RsbU (phosphoserine phosphatase)
LSAEERCALLLEIARRSRGTLDLGQIFDRLLDAVSTVVEFDAAGIFALNEVLAAPGEPVVGKIAAVARRGYQERPVADDRMLSAGEGLIGRAIRTGRSVLASDVWSEPHYVVGRPETLSEIVVPILFEGRGIAALDVESDRLAAYAAADLERLEFFAEAAAMAIEKAMLHRRLVELEQVGAQVRLAREVQLGLLPRLAPDLPGWQIAGLCRPSLELGGDLYDHFPLGAPEPAGPESSLGAGRHGLVIGDVAGKGVPAALIMATFRALLRARRGNDNASGPAATVAAVSRLLRESTATRAFVTCCYAVLEAASGEIVYASCGHPPPLLIRGPGKVEKVEELGNCGPALGAFEHESFVERRVRLDPGDCLLLYTDGLTEALDPAGEAFGGERVREAFVELAGRAGITAVGIADELVRRVVDHVAAEQLADDLTLVVVRRLP